jgi:hypothetical protein
MLGYMPAISNVSEADRWQLAQFVVVAGTLPDWGWKDTLMVLPEAQAGAVKRST